MGHKKAATASEVSVVSSFTASNSGVKASKPVAGARPVGAPPLLPPPAVPKVSSPSASEAHLRERLQALELEVGKEHAAHEQTRELLLRTAREVELLRVVLEKRQTKPPTPATPLPSGGSGAGGSKANAGVSTSAAAPVVGTLGVSDAPSVASQKSEPKRSEEVPQPSGTRSVAKTPSVVSRTSSSTIVTTSSLLCGQ